MNITGGVVLGMLYLLPGIFFVFGLSRSFNSKIPSPFDGQLSTGIVLALLVAILAHLFSIGMLKLFGANPTPDPVLALQLLLGDFKSELVQRAMENAGRFWLPVGLYFLITSGLSYFAGKLSNRLWADDGRADWYELLTRDADLLWLTVDVQIGASSYLYAGTLTEFRISSTGDLQRVVLIGAARRRFNRPTQTEMDAKDEKYIEGGWVQIPGEYVVLDLADTKSVNIDYWYLENLNEQDEEPLEK